MTYQQPPAAPKRAPFALRLALAVWVVSEAAAFIALASFIGIGDDPRWESEVAKLSFPPRAEAWREKLDPSALESITSIQRERLESLGYLS